MLGKLTLDQDTGLYCLWIHAKAGTLDQERAGLLAARLDKAAVPFHIQNVIAAAGYEQRGFRDTLTSLGLRTY